MNNRKSIGLFCALALAATFATESAAQGSHDRQATTSGNAKSGVAEGVTRSLPDMRLWSFADCDSKFPYINTDEHQECVRVVGSDEARDARAYRVCETSNGNPEEVARCKSTYKANKDRSARSGYVPNSAPESQAQAQVNAEDLQRVRAIAAAAVEGDQAASAPAVAASAAAAPAAEGTPRPGIAPPPPEESGRSTLVMALVLGAVLVGAGAYFARRRQGGMVSAR